MILQVALLTSFIATGVANAEEVESPPIATNELVQRQFRDYRIAIYDNYRTQRHEYDRRRMLGETLFDQWQTAGRDPNQAMPVIAWYQDATEAASFGFGTPLPELPKLEPVGPVIDLPQSKSPDDPPTTAQAALLQPPSAQVVQQNEPVDGRQFELPEDVDNRDPFDDSETAALLQEFAPANRTRNSAAEWDTPTVPAETETREPDLDLPLIDPNDKITTGIPPQILSEVDELFAAADATSPDSSNTSEPDWFTALNLGTELTRNEDAADQLSLPSKPEVLETNEQFEQFAARGSGEIPEVWKQLGGVMLRALSE